MANINTLDLEKCKGIKLLHLNVRSILKKVDQLRLYFENSKIDIITISETWAKRFMDSQLLGIRGFEMVRQDRDLKNTRKKSGGGLITYIRTAKFDNFVELEKLGTSGPDIEAQTIKVKRPHSKDLIICNQYRPPTGKVENMFDYFNNCLGKINRSKTDLYIMGDMNINYLKKNSPVYKKLNFFLKANRLEQIVHETTRHTDKSNTLIDLILTDDRHITECGMLNIMISDHQPIYVVKKKAREKRDQAFFTGRSYKNFDLASFREHLTEEIADQIYAKKDPEGVWQYLLTRINEYLDSHCPIRDFRIPNYKPDWITQNLLEQIRDRDYYYSKAKNTKNEDDWRIAKHLRNVTNNNIRKAKANYIIDRLEQFRDNSTKFWKEVKKVFPASKNANSRTKILLKNNNTPVSEEDTADFINDFFINVGNTFAQLPKNKNKNRVNKANKAQNRLVECWSPAQVTEMEVYNIVKRINAAKSPGLKNINGMVIKEAFKTLTTPLTYMFNLSIQQGTFPDSWKVASVIPIPKGGDPEKVSNLRPISLLPQPGKVMEKLIHNQLIHYLEDKKLLSQYQHGFRKNRSTIGAIYQLLERININMDRSVPTLVTFIDFRKAFDCVQFDILLDKVSQLYLDKLFLDWIKDYLTHRQQTVVANNHTSQIMYIKQGVPQGSILGPLLYLIYANDLEKIIKKCGFSFYADDTVLYSLSGNFVTAKRNMQKNLNNIGRWCLRNGIYMNTSKTKYMIFGSKHTLSKIKTCTLQVNSNPIDRAESYNYLGMTLDPSLTFDKHVTRIIGRVSGKIKQLHRMRYSLTLKQQR